MPTTTTDITIAEALKRIENGRDPWRTLELLSVEDYETVTRISERTQHVGLCGLCEDVKRGDASVVDVIDVLKEGLPNPVDALSPHQREALELFLALPGAHEVIQGALVAKATGTTTTFLPGREVPVLAFVAYGDDAHIYKSAITGVEQAVLGARSAGAAEAQAEAQS